ncbi:hypothetical protein MUK42_02158 [Musa troglodytarum]|uniref:Uncharacterized protein n=1 Tax=Musa troglodytarum TaxID=320322 RepID=A0A9E7EX33_9LILI|nr:hypothetical protein MUK42_02158 [Musa troglodytarum]
MERNNERDGESIPIVDAGSDNMARVSFRVRMWNVRDFVPKRRRNSGYRIGRKIRDGKEPTVSKGDVQLCHLKQQLRYSFHAKGEPGAGPTSLLWCWSHIERDIQFPAPDEGKIPLSYERCSCRVAPTSPHFSRSFTADDETKTDLCLGVPSVPTRGTNRQPKVSYTREYLLSFSNLDICKKLPSGFDASILSEFDEASIIVNEQQRGVGRLTFPSTKHNEYGSSPPNRITAYPSPRLGSFWVDVTNLSPSIIFWKDNCQSEKLLASSVVRSWSNLMINTGFLRFYLYKLKWFRHSNDANFKFQTLVGILEPNLDVSCNILSMMDFWEVALPFQRKDDKDSLNDETFGLANYSSEDRVEEERRRRESFELMRKEQQKALQEKQKQIPDNHKEKLDADIIALLQNSADKKSIMNEAHKADDSSSLSINDSSRPPTLRVPLSRPLVPPGFSNTTLNKILPIQPSNTNSSEARFVDTVDNLPLDGTDNGQEKRNQTDPFLNNRMLNNGSISNVLVNDTDKIVIPASGLEVINQLADAENISCAASGLHKTDNVCDGILENDDSGKNEKTSEITHSLVEDSSLSFLEKLLGHSLSKSSGSPISSEVLLYLKFTYSGKQDFKTDEETWVPTISESSKFAGWFVREENKHLDDFSSKDLLTMIVNYEKVGSPASVDSSNKAIEHMAPSLPFKPSDMTKKLDASPAPSPVVLTCEDLEQLILTNTKGSSSNLQHAVQGTWMTKDGKLERQKSDVDDHASQHLLSLLQKGTKKEKEMVSVTSPALEIGSLERFSITDTCSSVNLGIVESNSCNSETVSSSEKTLTLEALFGSAFMSELQCAQAPVSVQRVVDDGVNTTAIPTSLGLPFPSPDVQCILGVGKEQRNSPVEDLKFSAADFEEKAPETHLPDEHSLISGMTSSQLPRRINRARPLDPGLDPLNRNQQMKPMGPEGIHHGPYLNFPENIVPYNDPHHGSDPRINPAAYNLMLQQMPIPGNFPQQAFLQGLPSGVPLSHPMNHMQGYIPKISNVHSMSLHHQQPNYDGLGMGMQGSLVGSGGKNNPEAFQRLIEMELRANAKPVQPAAADHAFKAAATGGEVILKQFNVECKQCRKGGGGFMEELFIISGNFLVQVTYGAYMVFLNGVFNAGVNPLFLVVFGNSVTAVVVLPVALAFEKKKWPTRLSATLLFHFLLLSLGGVTLFQALMLVGIKKASPDVASAMPNLTPGLIFIISACLRFEKFDACCWYSRTKIMGTLLCLAGVFTMCFLQGTSETPRLANNWSFLLAKPLTLDKAINKDWVLGCFYLLAGVFILSCTTVLQAATMLKFPAPLTLVVITSVMGSSLTALLQLMTEGKISVGPTTMSITSIVAIVLLGGVVMGTCMAFQGWCITKKGPVLVSIFCPIQTVSTVVVSAALLGQIISLGRVLTREYIILFCSLAGIVLMFAGLYVVLWAKKNETFSMLDVDAEPEVLVEDVEKPLLS